MTTYCRICCKIGTVAMVRQALPIKYSPGAYIVRANLAACGHSAHFVTTERQLASVRKAAS